MIFEGKAQSACTTAEAHDKAGIRGRKGTFLTSTAKIYENQKQNDTNYA